MLPDLLLIFAGSALTNLCGHAIDLVGTEMRQVFFYMTVGSLPYVVQWAHIVESYLSSISELESQDSFGCLNLGWIFYLVLGMAILFSLFPIWMLVRIWFTVSVTDQAKVKEIYKRGELGFVILSLISKLALLATIFMGMQEWGRDEEET